jgi:hypothetical protein
MGVTVSISKDRIRKRRKPLIAWAGSSSSCNRASAPTPTTIMIVALITLLTCAFVLIISPTLIVAALAQEGNNDTTTTGAVATITSGAASEASPPPEIGLSPQPDLNFSEIPVSEVNGTYVNANIGFQIDLPTGWEGTEINFLLNSVIAAPGETNLLEPLTIQEPSTFMTILGIDQEGFNMLEAVVSELPALGGGGADGGGQAETSLPQGTVSDPLGTTTTTMTPFGGGGAVSCIFSQPSFVTINGINAEERVGECTDGGGTNAPKTKSYVFATQDNSLIVVGFFGNSTITYDQNLPAFEESVRTISISRPADITTSEIYNRYKELVEIQQQQQQLSNQTSSGGM